MIDDESPEAEAPADPWSALLPGQEFVPAYLTSRFAAQYRVIVDVLLAEQDTSLTGLSYDEVAAGIRAHLAARVPEDVVDRLLADEVLHLDKRLERLVQWRVLTRWQEPARSGEDFLRRRDRYQLTPRAAGLHVFWSSVDDTEEAAGDLTLAPRAIHERLVAFAESVRRAVYTAAATEFQQIGAMHLAMATAARGWQRTLAHALSGGPDPAKQDLLWQTLRSYLGMWGEQVDVHTPRIAELLVELGPLLTPEVWRACVRAALGADVDEELVAAQAARWERTWEALGSWFSGVDSQARRLRRQLRDLVAPWARNMNLLLDTGGAVTRRAELLALAVAVERAPDDDSAWRIWDTAVGAFSARHLLLASGSTDEHDVSWSAAPPAPVTARFREQGARAAVGRRTKIPDYSTGKNAARRARLAAQAARGSAEAALRQRSGTRLAEWGAVTDAELDLLLEFVGVVRRTRSESAVTGDGRWRITLRRPPHLHDTTTLRADSGSMTTLNWYFGMEPA
ncbi:DUF2397 domain-containing protein [Saccharothrix australiensis]|uniref:Uncharacterized protein (TIGR02677 family) n=1 Tax=Saccharothrix australiensis TaxID=2072 RepID=A0A495W4D9_9PSEU|nr:DUF2397 domain-containing protein [Saccharothrix australiensis]RKT55523.1 uncharacterized protein (TIGR02677 family) [Saccharothrix australiensis]